MLDKLKAKWEQVCAIRLKSDKVPSRTFWRLIALIIRCIEDLYERTKK